MFTNLAQQLGALVRKKRTDLAIDSQQLADKCLMDIRYVDLLERGKYVPARYIYAMLHVLDIRLRLRIIR